jgi:hypothetical protein
VACLLLQLLLRLLELREVGVVARRDGAFRACLRRRKREVVGKSVRAAVCRGRGVWAGRGGGRRRRRWEGGAHSLR